MKSFRSGLPWNISRREFLGVVGATAGGLSVSIRPSVGVGLVPSAGKRPKFGAMVRAAFLYPPTQSLRDAGYYSWPGSSFDAERRQHEYVTQLQVIEQELGMTIAVDAAPLDDERSVTQFIDSLRVHPPDGLLLIPFKKGHWAHVMRIVETVQLPTVILATLGVLLSDHIQMVHQKTGVYLINSLDNFDAVEDAMKMILAARLMKDSRLLEINGSETKTTVVPHLGTTLHTVPHEKFYEAFRLTAVTNEVRRLARRYRRRAKDVVEPTEEDIVEAAKCYYALKRLIEEEQADALMMNCLPGLQKPRKHVPPCMGFMSLRDEGIPAGCQADLNATLTLMLVQYLFGMPGFQQNASMETERNHFLGAHCTSPSRMRGLHAPPEPYILRSHAEAGWGCVPRVLFTKGQDITMTLYLSGEAPQMLIYTGKVVGCPSMPPAGGCRTNIEMTINEVEDVRDVKGMHQVVFYGNYGKPLRSFCRLFGIAVPT